MSSAASLHLPRTTLSHPVPPRRLVPSPHHPRRALPHLTPPRRARTKVLVNSGDVQPCIDCQGPSSSSSPLLSLLFPFLSHPRGAPPFRHVEYEGTALQQAVQFIMLVSFVLSRNANFKQRKTGAPYRTCFIFAPSSLVVLRIPSPPPASECRSRRYKLGLYYVSIQFLPSPRPAGCPCSAMAVPLPRLPPQPSPAGLPGSPHIPSRLVTEMQTQYFYLLLNTAWRLACGSLCALHGRVGGTRRGQRQRRQIRIALSRVVGAIVADMVRLRLEPRRCTPEPSPPPLTPASVSGLVALLRPHPPTPAVSDCPEALFIQSGCAGMT